MSYSYFKVYLPTQNQSYQSCYLTCKISVAFEFNCATLLNLGAPLAKNTFHVARKNAVFLNSCFTVSMVKLLFFPFLCVKLTMLIYKWYFFHQKGHYLLCVQIMHHMCRKWDIFLQKWGLPRGCFQGSVWWSLLPSCLNVYSSKSAKLCSQVQLWPWFWILSRGLQWTSSA